MASGQAKIVPPGGGVNLPARIEKMNTAMSAWTPDLAVICPKWMKADTLVAMFITQVRKNQLLSQASEGSLRECVFRCAETGLPPTGPGGMWIIPYRNNRTGTIEAQAIPDYRGLINLAKQNGDINDLYAYPVYENDQIEIEYGLEPSVRHIPMIKGDHGKLIGCYAVVLTVNDNRLVTWMDIEAVQAIKRRSKAADRGPWVTDFEAMALKTVIRRSLKPFTRSARLQKAIEYDNDALGLDDDESTPPPVEHPPVLPPQPQANPATVQTPANPKTVQKPSPIEVGIKKAEAELFPPDAPTVEEDIEEYLKILGWGHQTATNVRKDFATAESFRDYLSRQVDARG